MEFDTTWDIEKYRTKFESQEHWDLKQEFMLAHKELFPEDRLICLAQVYVNVQLLGCKYPDKLMEQVHLLSKGLGQTYTENKKQRLQRTFVKASDAASAKVRAKRRTPTLEPIPAKKFAQDVNNHTFPRSIQSEKDHTVANGCYFYGDSESRNFDQTNHSINNELETCTNSVGISNEMSSNYLPAFSSGNLCDAQKLEDYLNLSPKDRHTVLKDAFDRVFTSPHHLSRAIIHFKANDLSAYIQMVVQTASFSKIKLEFCYTNLGKDKVGCDIKLSDIPMGRGIGAKKKEAKQIASKNTMLALRDMCFAIQVLDPKNKTWSVTLDSLYKKPHNVIQEMGDPSLQSHRISNNNIGAKLLMLMGWDGRGLGRNEEGIIDPVCPKAVIGRQGLGLKEERGVPKHFKKNVRKILTEYVKDDSTIDLFFSSDLSSDQRKEIHMIAQDKPFRDMLKSRSYGKDMDRYLVISKYFSTKVLLERLIEEGGETEKYKLFPPGVANLEK